MSKPAPKGLVLAAGLGTRLKPLTDYFPKPLIPFAGSSPLELAMWRLKMAGLEEVAVNSHYFTEQIATFVKENPFNQQLKLSFEKELLGTGGVYNPLRNWLGESDLVVYNGDVISDIDVDALIDLHESSGAIATMALLPKVLAGESGVWCASAGAKGSASARLGDQILGFGTTVPKHAPQGLLARNFACVQILSKRFIEYLPKTGVFDVISQGYEVALKAGELVLGQVHDGFWHDIRSPRFYFEAVKDFLLTDPARDITGLYALRRHLGKTQSLIPAGKEITGEFVVVGPVIQVSRHSIGGGAHVGPFAVLEDRVEIAQNARVSHSVILPGARIDTGEIISRMIVGKGFRLSLDAPSA